MTSVDAEVRPMPDGSSVLKQVSIGSPSASQVVLVGNMSVATQLMVVWFPMLAVFLSGFISLFVWTDWGEDNLWLLMTVWALIWLVLVLLTFGAGLGRHFYVMDMAQRRLTHLNSGESMTLVLAGSEQQEQEQPVSSGLKLGVDIAALARLTAEEARDIPEWQLPAPKTYFLGAESGGVTAVGVIAAITVGFLLMLSGMWRSLFFYLLALLVAWAVGCTLRWAMDRRQRQVLMDSLSGDRPAAQ